MLPARIVMLLGLTACSGAVQPTPPDGGTDAGGAAGDDAGPNCAGGLPVPLITQQCPDGSNAIGTYLPQGDGCVLTISCPPVPPPVARK
jgi:hypothetical protein